MKKYTFVLNFGYVESSGLCFMPWTSVNSYKSAKDALLDLALFLQEQYVGQTEPPKKCCTASKQKDSEAQFCSKCGKPLLDKVFDGEGFIDWLRHLDGIDVDSFHSDFVEWDDNHRWESEGLEDAPNQRFVYQAEWVLAAAVGYSHGGNPVTFEKICENRTRNKTESFAYYG